jgi:hypothetical protein
MLFLPILTIAQDIVADKYYFILEGDTIEGFYSDFEIENGKFEQFKVIEAVNRSRLNLAPLRSESTLNIILRAEYQYFKPSG